MPPSKPDGISNDRKSVVVARFNLGNQQVTVFQRQSSDDERVSLSLQLERRYRKRDGEFESSKFDLFPGDIATATALLARAQAWVIDQSEDQRE